MAFDIGGALATALVVGTISGALFFGTGYISGRIENWKKNRWHKQNQHLSPEQLQRASDERVKKSYNRDLLIWIAVFAIFIGGFWVIAQMGKA